MILIPSRGEVIWNEDKVRLQPGLASLYDTPLAFRISFQSRHCCSLYHQRHAHDTAYLPHTWAFYLRPHSFSRSTSLSFFSLCAYTVLILRTKYCLVVGIQFSTGSLRWKKGGRCTAFATRHEEHLSEMEADTTIHLFRPMLGVKTCPGVVERVMDFSFGLNFRIF